MKRINLFKFFFILVLFWLFRFTEVGALSCNSTKNAKIIKASNNIRVNYEVKDNSRLENLKVNNKTTNYVVPDFVFEISIYNLVSEDVYIRVTNEKTNKIFDVSSDITNDGVYTFKDYDFSDFYDYKFEINSAIKPCTGEKVKTLTLKKPKYNVFSEYDYCKENKSYFCKKFITSNLSFSDEQGFFKQINVNQVKSEKNDKSFIESLKQNRNILLISIAGSAVLAVVIIVIIKFRSRGDKL